MLITRSKILMNSCNVIKPSEFKSKVLKAAKSSSSFVIFSSAAILQKTSMLITLKQILKKE